MQSGSRHRSCTARGGRSPQLAGSASCRGAHQAVCALPGAADAATAATLGTESINAGAGVEIAGEAPGGGSRAEPLAVRHRRFCRAAERTNFSGHVHPNWRQRLSNYEALSDNCAALVQGSHQGLKNAVSIGWYRRRRRRLACQRRGRRVGSARRRVSRGQQVCVGRELQHLCVQNPHLLHESGQRSSRGVDFAPNAHCAGLQAWGRRSGAMGVPRHAARRADAGERGSAWRHRWPRRAGTPCPRSCSGAAAAARGRAAATAATTATAARTRGSAECCELPAQAAFGRLGALCASKGDCVRSRDLREFLLALPQQGLQLLKLRRGANAGTRLWMRLAGSTFVQFCTRRCAEANPLSCDTADAASAATAAPDAAVARAAAASRAAATARAGRLRRRLNLRRGRGHHGQHGGSQRTVDSAGATAL